MNLEEFTKEFTELVFANTDSEEEGEFRENEFTREVLSYLVDGGECIDPEVAYFKDRGVKLNAWDISEESNSLDLFVSIFIEDDSLKRVTHTEVADAITRARKFLERSLQGLWKEMEESSEGFEVAQAIHSMKSKLKRARIYVLTNGIAPAEIYESENINSIEISNHIVDIERLFQASQKGNMREPIEVSKPELEGGLPYIVLPTENETYDSFLAIFPGSVLASLYAKWGQRLLEQNVRSYLQARGSVNKGIIDTVLENPTMFFAYNNGISAIAESVSTEPLKDGMRRITGLKNFQIVNGAQTTASLNDAYRNKGADISEVFVQVKITVLKDISSIETTVPMISRYANTQTKVNLSDFSANHHYHRKLEQLSRIIWVPNEYGKSTTKWYYERTRGEYINDVNAEFTESKKRAFRSIYPKNQILNKTLVAKYEMTWNQQPHIVSLGSEKNFSHFMDAILGDRSNDPDESYFKRLVSKGILFKECDRLVSRQNFGGYKANIVTYTVAWLSHITAQRLDLEAVWNNQRLTDATINSLELLSKSVWEHISDPPTNMKNISEWCKKEACWDQLIGKDHPELDLGPELISLEKEIPKEYNNFRINAAPTKDEAEEIEKVKSISADVWFSIATWAKKTDNLKSWQRSLSFSIGNNIKKGRPISPRQARQSLILFQEASDRGFTYQSSPEKNQ